MTSPHAAAAGAGDFRSRGRGGGGGGKRTICLWQFLRELLLNPHLHHNWIRWIDRNKGRESRTLQGGAQ